MFRQRLFERAAKEERKKKKEKQNCDWHYSSASSPSSKATRVTSKGDLKQKKK